MPVSSWDDFPVHQAPEFIRHPATSDRNFYDRYYFNLHPCGDAYSVIFGLGQYPNLGVTDAFVSVRSGDEQHVVRSSRPLTDRMDMSVGPIRVEVLEPLRRLRVVVEPTEHTVAADVAWEAAGPAVPEPRQYLRSMEKVVFDTQRLAQVGSWSGFLEVGGRRLDVDPATCWGARDRSWGIRPVGEPEPAGIREGIRPLEGMWNYFPMRFADHAVYYILNETDDGRRLLEMAQRVWADGRVEELGRAEHRHRFTPGTRLLSGSTVAFPDAGLEIDCTPLLANFISVGTGYGLESDWRHGMYQGPEVVVQGSVYRVPEIVGVAQYAVVDHTARFEYRGNTGYGLYEHAFSGPFRRYGMQDAYAPAP